jgi:hypothetical protein
MKTLALQLTKLWPELLKGFDKHIQENWSKMYFETFPEWKKGKKTQEVTKAVSLAFSAYIKVRLKSIGLVLIEGNGFDFEWDGVLVECKLSLSIKEGWLGNGFKKVSWHLLIKINFDENGLVQGSFVCLVPLSECESKWTKSSEDTNYSALKLLTVDYDKIIKVVGDFKKNPVYLKPLFV